MIEQIAAFWKLSPRTTERILYSAAAFVFLFLLKEITYRVMNRKIRDDKRRYHARKSISYAYSAVVILVIGSIWFRGMTSLGTFLGLMSAGLAVALHDPISNMAGFFFIEGRKPFRVGDRVEIDGTQGDVIDIRLFQFSIVEVGNWVDADQSTGRIIHVPNNLAMRKPLANSHAGFEYIWNEIPVLITFESDWKTAKDILHRISRENTEFLSEGAQVQIRKAAKRYLIVAGKLTPTVYTTVKESGVCLTIRYLVNPRQRRGTEQKIWEEVLDAFAGHSNIHLAYPTIRYYSGPAPLNQEHSS
ncbi:mechanosensitive ion channel family protein [Pontiella agarivorans]|uniref:Mechanosensitive ion channel family protein n=1 Tax=Pontiella agarivorans TaxID=3038953 RepID=A0ABU5MVT8_9BACT|nr:mechanosensitive ion channel family protein [Pontiella agarivorans]MDZ8118061.1 mechanosensitive ion channel family protein [Pontiella agarivorans]